MNITREILELLSDKYCHIDWCSSYGEKGYSHEKEMILFSNWNRFPKYVNKALEKQFELEWSDEWIISDRTHKCYRTKGDCWHWKPYYTIINDCEVVGGDELENDNNRKLVELYINEELIDNPDKVNLFNIKLSSFGFELIDDNYYESGWYGRSDNPSKILKDLKEKFPDKEFIFSGLRNEQFRSTFYVYGREIQP